VSVLDGVVVLEYAQYVAGPLCGLLLSDMGATVIKVEPPAGDAYRRLDPIAPGMSRYFLSLNRGKRSITVDLKSESGRRTSDALQARADIVVHNFTAARAKAFGLDWAELSARNPGVVACVINSFGETGPLAGKAAYDLIAQAHAGLLVEGARRGDGVPVRAGGIPMSDLTAGFLAATGTLGAFHRAQSTGCGEQVDISLLAAAMAVQIQDLVDLPPLPPDGERPSPATRADLDSRAGEFRRAQDLNPYYRCYEAQDGFMAVACLNVDQRRALLEMLELDDEGVANPDAALRNDAEVDRRRDLTRAVEARLRKDAVARWVSAFEARGVPCGPVQTRGSLTEDEQVRATGLLQRTTQDELGEVAHLGPLLSFGGERPHSGRPAPRLGEGNDEFLDRVLAGEGR
jgi:crotonobetainyl-CoA:carnitine CoA-transferase CaiB-like acyl-CoA transferase